MSKKYYYEIEEDRSFNKPTKYRLVWYDKNWYGKKRYHLEEYYVDESNRQSSIIHAFVTEDQEEIKRFKQFCIDDDNAEEIK